MQNNYEHIPQEKFAFAQLDKELHDQKFDTKSRSYMQDAFLRFKKNKSSVFAAWIIIVLVIFSIVSPIISPYDVSDEKDNEKVYQNYPPFVESIANLGIGILDGGHAYETNETALAKLRAVYEETGYNPIIKELGKTGSTHQHRGQTVTTWTYNLRVNYYYKDGIKFRTITYAEYEAIQKYQNETGIQVIYPAVELKDTGFSDTTFNNYDNIWYKVKDDKGTPAVDENGNFIPAYSSNTAIAGPEYNSIRIARDPGNYIYAIQKQGESVQVRVCYYNYYKYINGHAPFYLFGTNSMGQDIFEGIGVGARFSLIFAVIVSAINLTIGAVYGAIQGYYGGMVDMILDRITDILANVPTLVTVTLFQLHLAKKVGVLGSFIFAFILTGWIGMSALTRKQFYRFKNQEFVFAARTLGASDWRLMFKHVFPNAIGTIITSCALVIPGVISSETTLTYLGIINLQDLFGTTIGVLMSQGQTAMQAAPHAMFFPALFVSLLLISFNLFGNGLRDAFNPSTRGVDD